MTQENPIFWLDSADTNVQQDAINAQRSFKYFWRELFWENRRIIPAIDLAIVKVVFSQEIDGEIYTEHMWINDVYFDGETIYGILANEPYDLTNVKAGDEIAVPLTQISDWLISLQGEALGGFTINTIRVSLDEKERQEHDEAWGIDFGDINHVKVVSDEFENPNHLVEHPMSINMKQSFIDFLYQHPNELTFIDENGNTLLHQNAIAGNKTIIEILLGKGVDKSIKNNFGKTAYDYAKELDWQHIVSILEP